MEKILLALCSLLSCFIITYILFQFMDERYQRAYKNKRIYFWSGMGATVFMAVLNLLDISMLNLFAWIVLFAVGSGFLYFENNVKSIKRIVNAKHF